MSRLIDADVLERRVYTGWLNGELIYSEWIDFREWLKDEPTVEPAPHWHRAEEPPKQYGAFAVACVYDGKWYWCKGIYLDGKWLREGDGIEIPADYWMPLPEPKEEDA